MTKKRVTDKKVTKKFNIKALYRLRFALVLIFITIGAISSRANVILVENTLDTGAGSLRDALESAVAYDTVLINTKGTITLSSQILLDGKSDISIIGPFPKHTSITPSSGWSGSLIRMNNCARISFSGIGFVGSTGTTRHVSVFDASDAIVFITCLFENGNLTSSDGAAIAGNDAQIKLINCSFINNTAVEGGALFLEENSFASIINCTFSGNSATDKAGVIRLSNTSEVFSYYSTYVQNTAVNAPEVVYGTGGTKFHIENNAIGDNGVQQQINVLGDVYSTGGSKIKLNYVGEPTDIGVISASDLVNTSVNLGLRADLLEDGYGLKYWPIVDPTSDLINAQAPTANTPSTDCRNAPRSLKGTSISLAYPDAGAAEYTHLRVTNSSGDKADPNSFLWTLEADQRKDPVSFIEFDITAPASILLEDEAIVEIETYLIDGFTQEGSSISGPNETGTYGLTGAILPIILEGSILWEDNGIRFLSGSANSKLIGVSVQDFDDHGISIEEENIAILGCEIGITSAGVGNGSNDAGIIIYDDEFVIGGWQHWQRNVISGNGMMGGSENANIYVQSGEYGVIFGNIIGLQADGLSALSAPLNTNTGIYLNDKHTAIGSSLINTGNIICDNNNGIFLTLVGDYISIQQNKIGVGWDGSTALGNATAGIFLNGSDDAIIGGLSPSQKNIIAHNTAGIVLKFSTTAALNNRIVGNSIFQNTNQGIDIDNNGSVLPNDGVQSSSQNNYGFDYPELIDAFNCDLTETIINYELRVNNGTYRIEFFTNTSPDPTNGEGETFLGAQTVTVTSNPQAFSFGTGTPLPAGTSISATLTSNSFQSTSEFGSNVIAVNGSEGEISYLDICYGSTAIPTISGDIGGVFWYNGGDPGDGSSLDATTGELMNGVEGATYSIVYGFEDGCGINDTADFTVLVVDETFSIADFCPADEGIAIPSVPGGTFSLSPDPGDGAEITAEGGILTGAIEGVTYTIQYIVSEGACTDTGYLNKGAIITDASFVLADFCPLAPSAPAVAATPGGTYSILSPLDDGASINSVTGAITNGVEGTTYAVKYNVGPCDKEFTLDAEVIAVDESFSYPDFCAGEIGIPSFVATPGGTFYLEDDFDAAYITPLGELIGGVSGATYNVIYQVGVCADRDTVSVHVVNADATFTFADFCVAGDSSATGPIAVQPANANYILLDAVDGATINPLTGIIYNPVEGTTYIVVDSAAIDGCWDTDTITVQAIEVNENFSLTDICFGEIAIPLLEDVTLTDTFFFASPPLLVDPVVIDPYTGEVSAGSANISYTVRRIAFNEGCADSTEQTFTVNQPNADFAFLDFCPTDVSPEPSAIVEGGLYSFAFPVGFGETIDMFSGVIGGPQEDSTYAVVYTLFIDGCENADTQFVHVINVPEEFDFDDFCWTADSEPGMPEVDGGVWSFAMPYPMDDAVINEVTGIISGATEGTEYTVEYTVSIEIEDLACSQEDSMVVTAIGVNESFVFPDICPTVASPPPSPSTAGGTYSFIPADPGDGASINAATGVITSGVEGATYTLEYVAFDPTGLCSESSSETVNVTSIDESFSTEDFCASLGSEVIMPATSGGTFSFAPDLGDVAMIHPITGVISGATGGTTYEVQYSISVGSCTELDTNTIFAKPSLDPSFTLEDHCANLELLAEITGTLGGTFDFETPPVDGATIDPVSGLITDGTGNTYAVRYIIEGDAETCADTLVLSVTLFPTPVIITLESDISTYCPDENIGPIHVADQINAFKVYWYQDNEGTILLDSTFNFLPSSLSVGNNTFYAQAKSTEGCLGEIESFSLLLSDTSGMRAGSDISVCLGSPAQLEAFGGSSYLWSTHVPLGDYTEQNPVAFSLSEENYAVRITNNENCDVFDTMRVTFNPQNECEIELYNAFSPNGDGTNDFWYIENLINYMPNTVYIYTRWGDEVIMIENYDNITVYWDGTDGKGRELAPGTYFYVVITELSELNQAGWVQIVR